MSLLVDVCQIYLIPLFISMSESTSYNLRSNKTDPIQVPIQLQLNNDTDFLSQLLQTNNQAQRLTAEESGSSDESDLNCSDIIDNSDGEKTGEQETVKSDNVDETAQDNAAVQQMINSQILSQLQTISHRLDKIEQTHSKKTNDPKLNLVKKSKLALTSLKLLAQTKAKCLLLQSQSNNKSCHRI